MAEDKPATPEQQLLKLIEGESAKGGSASGGKPEGKPKGRRFSLAWSRAFSFRKRAAKKKTAGKRPGPGIAEVNKALIAATVVVFVYVVFDAVASARNLQRPPNFAPLKEMKANTGKESVAPLEETSYYLQKVSSRDIFREGKKKEAAPVQSAPAAVDLTETAEAIQGLALVGISWSSNPDAIIEDKAKQRTYFVKRGQDVGDGVKVEAIFKDHVVVTYQDREYELR